MSDPGRIADNLAERPAAEFPTPATPTIFADGVSSYAPGAGVTKFFLYRLDPNMYARGGVKANPIAQVVMPVHGFAQTAALFQHGVRQLITAGLLSQSDFDQMIRGVEALNPPPTTSDG